MDKLCSLKEAAEILCISQSTLRYLRQNGHIVTVQHPRSGFGSRKFIKQSELNRYLEEELQIAD